MSKKITFGIGLGVKRALSIWKRFPKDIPFMPKWLQYSAKIEQKKSPKNSFVSNSALVSILPSKMISRNLRIYCFSKGKLMFCIFQPFRFSTRFGDAKTPKWKPWANLRPLFGHLRPILGQWQPKWFQNQFKIDPKRSQKNTFVSNLVLASILVSKMT